MGPDHSRAPMESGEVALSMTLSMSPTPGIAGALASAASSVEEVIARIKNIRTLF